MSRFIEKLNLEDGEKDTLVNAWNILKDTNDDLYAEDGEDTDQYHLSKIAFQYIGLFLDTQEIEYEEIETGTMLNCGVTECCGYDFGADAFGKKKPKFCPMCGKKITKVN